MTAFATWRLVLFAKSRKDATNSVALRVTYRRKSKYFFLNRHCPPEQWNKLLCRFEKTFPGYKKENDILLMYERRASDALHNMERDGIPFTFERFEQAVFFDRQTGGSTSASIYVRSIADEMEACGKFGNSRFYRALANALDAFRPKAALSEIDAAFLSKFERWHHTARNVSGGGLSVVMRTLRAACNRAVSEKLMPAAWCPFASYSLAHLKSRKAKKSAGLAFIRTLEQIELEIDSLRFARDLFLFSFYCRGINLADIAELTPANIQGGRLVYTRKKTGRLYSVKLSERALATVAKYATTERLFPIYTGLERTEKQRFYRKQRVEKEVNRALRQIAGKTGTDIAGLSFYTARHTYADSLKKAGVSVEVISQALGHADIRTTDNSLQSFGDDVIDAADDLLQIKKPAPE